MRLRARRGERRSTSDGRNRPRTNFKISDLRFCQIAVLFTIKASQFLGFKSSQYAWLQEFTARSFKDHAITAPSERFIACALEFLLEDYLPKIERCLERLTDEQIWWRPNEESNSIGNLVLHLCGNARQWIVSGVGGEQDARNRDAEFAQREVMARGELLSLLRTTLEDVARVLRALDPATLLERRSIQGSDVDVLEAIFHVTEHFSMHTGQIIMLTKMLTSADLRFYGFEAGAPVERWRSGSAD